jgi:hypothetical protein
MNVILYPSVALMCSFISGAYLLLHIKKSIVSELITLHIIIVFFHVLC